MYLCDGDYNGGRELGNFSNGGAETHKNLYRGVNPHLQSLAQLPPTGTVSLWSGFHSKFIAKLDDALSAQLRPMGYFTRQVGGIQFRIDERDQTRYPDIPIYADAPRPTAYETSLPNIAATLVLPTVEAFQ